MKKFVILSLITLLFCSPMFSHKGPKGHKHTKTEKVKSYDKKDGTHVDYHKRKTK
jgi:hypothetical protein